MAVLLLVPTVAAAQPGPPPPGYAPAYVQASPWAFHQGITFEANVGVGFMWERVSFGDGTSATSDTFTSLGGVNLGVGGWVSPNLAITARAAGVTYSQSQDDGAGGTISTSLTGAFLGPSVQYWLDPHLWIGGGAGLAIAFVESSSDSSGVSVSSDNQTGFGLDLRAGYTFSSGFTPNTWNLSVEFTPGFFGADNNTTVQLNGFAILFGYQYL